MPNGLPGSATRPGSSTGAVRAVMQPVSQSGVARPLVPNVPYRSRNRRNFERYGTFARQAAIFAHPERKSRPVRAYAGVRGRIADVPAARIYTHRVSLVARRHVDFK